MPEQATLFSAREVPSVKPKHSNKLGKTLKDFFIDLVRAEGLPEPIWGDAASECRPLPGRQVRLDFAWPEYKVNAEVDGGLYSFGAHSRGASIESDNKRDADLQIAGWIVLRFGDHAIKGYRKDTAAGKVSVAPWAGKQVADAILSRKRTTDPEALQARITRLEKEAAALRQRLAAAPRDPNADPFEDV